MRVAIIGAGSGGLALAPGRYRACLGVLRSVPRLAHPPAGASARAGS